jgi:hypothetical protein
MQTDTLDAPLTISLADLQTGIQNEEDSGFKLTDLSKGTVAGAPMNVATFLMRVGPLADAQLVLTPAGLFTPDGNGGFTVSQVLNDSFVQQLATSGLAIDFYSPVVSINGNDTALAVARQAGALPATNGNPLQPAPGATQTSQAVLTDHVLTGGDQRPTYDGVSSATSGLSGQVTTYSDGTVITTASESLTARIDGLGRGPQQANLRIVVNGTTTTVQQTGYSYRGRILPICHLETDFAGFPAGTPIVAATATRFGKSDPSDGGVGAPLFGLVQTCSGVFGASIKVKRLINLFGSDYASSPDVLTAMVEVFNPGTGKFARVPLVDIGPGVDEVAELDLTAALDAFLGNSGSAAVQFRIA